MSKDPDPVTLMVPLVEEVPELEKRRVTTGRVQVQTTTHLREEVLREKLGAESVEVERVPIDRIVDAVPELRTEGDVTIVPVLEERLVVTKQLVLVEEVRIRRRRSIEQVEVPVTLRRQVADVVEQGVDTGGSTSASTR